MDLEHVFLCGSPALDFAATLRARDTVRFELFVTPERLSAWFLGSGLVDAVTSCDEADVAAAIALREAVYALVTARRRDEPYGEDALAAVNAAAGRPPATPRLTPAGRWTQATAPEALSTVARHAVELLAGPDAPLMKECANPPCTRVFLDRSRGSRRQWCGMESCGNRLKAAAYRSRKRQAATAT
ncbi:CGNR zinc finger domain-containing protein [Streptomyces sp. NPDC050560]|uniref:CGNR zinc finger domain-containing protein n=1 Tax=Streptomyces sp. NPDC050560 TaxID=3365630 RepID=UPI0037B5C600